MRTELAKRLEIEFPIFAFTHCRDVVAAVSNAGGIGVLGAVGFTAEQLEVELKWIDEHTDKPYGVDIVIPGKYEGKGDELDADALEEKLRTMIPAEHREFAKKLLAEHGVPELPPDEKPRELLGWTAVTAGPQIETALKHDKVRLIANALGTPPEDVVKEIQDAGRLVGALCGSPRHAMHHVEAGLDFIIAQGTEGGGHTGEIGSMVLWPQVIEAVSPIPVLAAGGIHSGKQMAAALAMGCEGIWTGSIWLTVEEAEAAPEEKQTYLDAGSHDAVRSRSWTGKPCRMLRNDWTQAWGAEDTPDPLGMPLQFMVTSEAVSRTHRYPAKSQKVAFNPVGQVVGAMNEVTPVREVIQSFVEDYVDALEHLNAIMPE